MHRGVFVVVRVCSACGCLRRQEGSKTVARWLASWTKGPGQGRTSSSDGSSIPTEQGARSQLIELAKLMRHHAKYGDVAATFKVLKEIDRRGLPRNDQVNLHLMEAFGKNRNWREAFKVFRGIKRPNIFHYNYMLSVLGRSGMTEESKKLFQEMLTCNVKPDILSFNSYLVCFAKNGRKEDIDDVLQQMRDCGLTPNDVTYNTVLHGFALRKDTEGASRVVKEMVDHKIPVTTQTLNTLLHVFVNSGDLVGAVNLFSRMLQQEPQNTGPAGAAGATGEAVARLDTIVELLMQDGKFAPSLHTFATLLTAFARAMMPDHAIAIVDRLKLSGLRLNIVVYNSLLHALVKSGRLQQARDVLVEMRASGIPPDTMSYGSIMFGHAFEADPKSVKELMDEMKARNMEPTTDNYNALALALINGGSFQLAREALVLQPPPPNKHTEMLRECAGLEGASKQIIALVKRRKYLFAVQVFEEATDQGVELMQDAASAAREAVAQAAAEKAKPGANEGEKQNLD